MKRIIVKIIFYLSAIPLVILAIHVVTWPLFFISPLNNMGNTSRPFDIPPLVKMEWKIIDFIFAPQKFFMSPDRFPRIYYFPTVVIYIFVFITSGLLMKRKKIKSKKTKNS
ncbi:MAG: hypothetical protein ACYDIA_17300 [Candidatus Humimicrobiaceae bacterium]